jgi:cold shock CspA family protein
MSFTSGKPKAHEMRQTTEAARVIAKLLASRQTPIDEIPNLIENVERALASIEGKEPVKRAKRADAPTVQQTAEEQIAAPREAAPAPRSKRIAAVHDAPAPRAAEPVRVEPAEIKPAAPTLLRRAEVIHVAPAAPPAALSPPSSGTVRGVVQWFDTRTNRGTLRLQGLSSDLPVDGEILAASGLTRLFKGQEVEASLEGGEDTPKIAGLRLLNHAPASPVMGGTVRDRHAKQVVVELKREALSRAAARAEAELLLPSRRAR